MKRLTKISGLLMGLAVLCAPPGPAPTRAADAPSLSPDQAVFLLQYVASDYDLAVRDGKVVNAFEYAEVLRFTSLLQENHARARPMVKGTIPDLLATLHSQIAAKRPAVDVRATAAALLPLLAQSLGASPWSDAPADLEQGRRLYEASCASCHGKEGDGKGPAAAGLEPPATSFVDQRAQLLSPRQIAGAVRFGIDGTGMTAFEDVLNREEIRNVSFFVTSLIEKASLRVAGGAGQESGSPLEREALSSQAARAADLERAFTAVAERVFPAVVGITALMASENAPKVAAGQATRHGGWQRSQSAASRHPNFVPTGTGSGFFVRPDGTLLTARHFLLKPDSGELADRIEVELLDDQRYLAWVVGLEPMIDLAVLRLDAPFEVPVVAFGESEETSLGQWIIALGDPPGIERLFTVGSLSATPRRECYQEEPTETLFQTSAWVEPGVFGGPVVNLDGRVLGMAQPRPGHVPQPHVPSALRILPIDLALTIYEALRVEAKKVSPWLGFSVLELSVDLRRRLRHLPRTGVYIDDVFDPGPASQAGVEVGDALVGVGDQDLLSVADFQRQLYLAGVGREVVLRLERDGQPIEKRVVIEQRPAHLLPGAEPPP